MAIGGEGRGFVGAPQVDRGLEVCIGKDRRSGNVSRPVVRPVRIGRKGRVDSTTSPDGSLL